MFLHYILQQNPYSLLYSFFEEQCANKLTGDWIHQVEEDLQILDISLTLQEIQEMSKGQFKSLVKKQTEGAALKYLLSQQTKLSKSIDCDYSKLETQSYLLSKNLSIPQKRMLFLLKSKMAPVKINRKFENTNDFLCDFCRKEEDSQIHQIYCEELKIEGWDSRNIDYQDIFSEYSEKQENIVKFYEAIFEKRKRLSQNLKLL